MKGDCFPKAVEVALELWRNDEIDGEITVVHGMPIGTGETNMGKRFWHAWVELKETIDLEPLGYPGRSVELTLCYDKSNDRDLTVPQGMYYNLGNLDEDHVVRYEMPDVMVMMEEYQHYGPWVDDFA